MISHSEGLFRVQSNNYGEVIMQTLVNFCPFFHINRSDFDNVMYATGLANTLYYPPDHRVGLEFNCNTLTFSCVDWNCNILGQRTIYYIQNWNPRMKFAVRNPPSAPQETSLRLIIKRLSALFRYNVKFPEAHWCNTDRTEHLVSLKKSQNIILKQKKKTNR